MDRFINCIAHVSSEGNLLIGDNATALFDCGMQLCANETIEKVKSTLDGRKLDYIFATHTHYDHIGALPFFRQAFPDVQLVTSDVGAAVLVKGTPRRVIRELSETAARDYGVKFDGAYSDDAFRADVIVKAGDRIDLGGISVEVIETPGHTRDSLSFYIPELELLILSETTGTILPDGSMYPSYLTGFQTSIDAIERCRKYPFKHLSLSHQGIVDSETAASYFNQAMELIIECRDFILDMREKGLSDDEKLELFFRKYGSETLLSIQPRAAFDANARATIACVFREFD
ncbi:MAG: MBL fold metallo-hydrolase [Oscillospiraceae bacterium]|nr:MBL fold metallo-hydrolase [Oscillospiraceae bacterium]